MIPMNIQATSRLADADRWDMADFLGDMYSQGVLTKEEYEARRDFALKAVTRAEVQALFRDIPKDMDAWKAERKMALVKAAKEQAEESRKTPPARMPYWLVAAGAFGVFANLFVADGAVRLTLAGLGLCAVLLGTLLKRT